VARIDVHKSMLAVGAGAAGQPEKSWGRRRFGTSVSELKHPAAHWAIRPALGAVGASWRAGVGRSLSGRSGGSVVRVGRTKTTAGMTQNRALKHDFPHACTHRPEFVAASGKRECVPSQGWAAVAPILRPAFALRSAFNLLHSKLARLDRIGSLEVARRLRRSWWERQPAIRAPAAGRAVNRRFSPLLFGFRPCSLHHTGAPGALSASGRLENGPANLRIPTAVDRKPAFPAPDAMAGRGVRSFRRTFHFYFAKKCETLEEAAVRLHAIAREGKTS
jgi:hypothetical protein